MEVVVTIARSDALWLGRPLTGKTGPHLRWVDNRTRGEEPGALSFPGGGYWQRESGMYLWKKCSERSISAPLLGFKNRERAGGIIGPVCYSADRTVAWHSWFPASARPGVEAPALLTSSPHTLQMCFSVPISCSRAPAESINCHNQCRLFSIPQETTQTKPLKAKDGSGERLAGTVSALRITQLRLQWLQQPSEFWCVFSYNYDGDAQPGP